MPTIRAVTISILLSFHNLCVRVRDCHPANRSLFCVKLEGSVGPRHPCRAKKYCDKNKDKMLQAKNNIVEILRGSLRFNLNP